MEAMIAAVLTVLVAIVPIPQTVEQVYLERTKVQMEEIAVPINPDEEPAEEPAQAFGIPETMEVETDPGTPSPLADEIELTSTGNVYVDVEQWSKDFEARWEETHDSTFEYSLIEAEEGNPYPTLLLGWMGEALYAEVYHSVEEDTYWYVASLYEAEVPEGEAELYNEYLYDAIVTGLTVRFAEIDAEEEEVLREQVKEIVQNIMSDDEATDNYFFYGENTFVNADYFPEDGLLECYIGY